MLREPEGFELIIAAPAPKVAPGIVMSSSIKSILPFREKK